METKSSKNIGWIYIISNPDMPGLLKIGYTIRKPSDRATELGGTGTPSDFIVEWSIRVTSPTAAEKAAHSKLRRFHHNKEWFRCETDVAIDLVADAVQNFSTGDILERAKKLDNFHAQLNQMALEQCKASYEEYLKNEKDNIQSAINSVITHVYLEKLQFRQRYTRDMAEKDFEYRVSKMSFWQKFNLPTDGIMHPSATLLASPEWKRQKIEANKIEQPLRDYLKSNYTTPRLNFEEFKKLWSKGRSRMPKTTPALIALRISKDENFLTNFDQEIFNYITTYKFE